MGARSPYLVVALAALWLVAASARAQESGPVVQPPGEPSAAGEPLPAGEPGIQCPCGPRVYFQADWLWTSHAGMWCDTPNFINGPNAASFDNLPAFSGDNGYRLQGGVRLGNWIIEGVYSHFGDWVSTLNENVNGVAFNAAGHAGTWAGENYINGGTYFTPIYNAASLASPVNTAGDQSGLGPSSAFPNDSRPALMVYSHSEFYMAEANIKGADYFFPLFGRGLRLGVGYVNANLNNDAWVGMSGTFRATNLSGGTAGTVSLPNSVLTAPTGGNLALYSGGGGGFTNGISNGGTGTPSQLFFTHTARTRNELNGAQLVLDGDLLEFNHLDLGASLKAGLFDNCAQGTITETYSTTNNDGSAYYRWFTSTSHQLAFLGGVGVNAGYHITDEISVCVGYQALFLSNLALGPEQVNGISNNWYRVQTNGTAVIQAVQTGLEIAF